MNMMEAYSLTLDVFGALQCELLEKIPERLKTMYTSDANTFVEFKEKRKDNKELINFYQIKIILRNQMMQPIKLVI